MLPKSLVISAVLLCIFGNFGCNGPLSGDGARYTLFDESGEDLQHLPTVARMHLGPAADLALVDLWWVEGEISKTSERSVRARAAPASVEKARLPLVSWRQGDEIVLAPSLPLLAGQTYSLVALGSGVLAQVRAADERQAVWRRFGPVPSAPHLTFRYCRFDALPSIEFGSELAGAYGAAAGWGGRPGEEQSWLGATDVSFERGLSQRLLADRCLTLAAPDVREVFVPPASIDDIALDPAPVQISEDSPHPSESPGFGLGDLAVQTVEGCRLIGSTRLCPRGAELSIESSGAFVAFEMSRAETTVGAVMLADESNVSVTVGPLVPNGDYHIEGVTIDGQGEEQFWSTTIHTSSRAPRFVINEVMADPFGAEPEGEWVELLNAGTAAGALTGYALCDDAGCATLPAVTLEPGGFGLVVRPDFVPQAAFPPSPDALPVVVPSLGKNGLRNSGETVTLRAPDGHVVSQSVALATKEDTSLARKDPWAPDTERSFEQHGSPGASPGRPNEF